MKGFLKNYTSNVPVSETVHAIEKVLIRCGVMGITKEYNPAGGVSAVRFEIPMNQKTVQIRLPADENKAIDALWKDYIGDDLLPDGKIQWGCLKKKRRQDFVEQGKRTAWKIIQDWVEVQMSMIHLQQAEPLQVFVSYIWDGHSTVYQRLKESNFRALLPEKAES